MRSSLLLFPALCAVSGLATSQDTPVAEVAKVYGSSTNAADLAGIAVAISEGTAVVGAQSNGSAASGGGAVFVFDLQPDGSWSEVQALTASTANNGDTLGRSVAISGDRAIAGATGKNGTAGADQGAAYVFERAGGAWTEVAELFAPTPVAGDQFGWSVAIDGNFAAVGAYRNDGVASNAGAVYMFERVAGVWTQGPVLVASDAKAGDQFGYALALDGSTLLVGADLEGPSGNGAGAAYVFEYNGSAWLETQKLKGLDTVPLDYFACSVALDGDMAAIGARGAESATDPFSWDEGAAYVFERVGGTWVQAARLEPFDATASDGVGYSVGIADGRVVIGSPDHDALGNNAGAAYLFERDATGAWPQTAKILASDGQSGDLIGRAVGVSGDRLVLGARGDDDQGSNAGAAYLLDLQPLSSAAPSISLAAGGVQLLQIDAGRERAGSLYWVLGSATGTAPGTPIAPGFVMPLVFDAYFVLTVSSPNQAPLLSTFGALNGVGHGSAAISIAPGTSPGLAGLTVNHAFFTIDTTTFATTFVSNAAPLVLVP